MSIKKVQKEGDRSSEGFRGIIILLILAKAQSLSLGQALHLGQVCQPPGHHGSLQSIPLRWMRSRVHCWDQGQGLAGISSIASTLTVNWTLISSLRSLMIKVLETFLAGSTKENCKSLKPVSVHYRNEA